MGRLELCSDPVPRMARGKSTKIRHVSLKNERGEELKVQLWGNLCDDIEEAVEMKKRGKTANIILTCLMSNNWNGCFAQSSFGTKIYINHQNEKKLQKDKDRRF
ncbi:hypothetical protein FRX31_028184 [Thalictrum thalictroides]|uniref:Uncharacterized protein n=1 Tax=Thalictrum thalictroides TaxID=46969 RepID=A0A7J6VAX5_THATH|nr:hypothetical protein FRX31_028184 [Thalictrum thalictroides]